MWRCSAGGSSRSHASSSDSSGSGSRACSSHRFLWCYLHHRMLVFRFVFEQRLELSCLHGLWPSA